MSEKREEADGTTRFALKDSVENIKNLYGVPAPDGGMLFLQADRAMNGTELAQVLTRSRVKLAVFNACWGAQPDQQGHQAIPRSSLAEVLLHHGVPAVLAMRDSIADQEALSFIQALQCSHCRYVCENTRHAFNSNSIN